MIKNSIVVVLSLLVASLFGCSSPPEELKTASELFDEATELENSADYIVAEEKFKELISTYPASNYSQQALLNQMVGNLNRDNHLRVIEIADQYINLYSESQHIDYALYMKGVSYFREDRGIFDKIGQQDASQRDLKLQKKAFEIFRELSNRFPDSKYTEDSIYRMRHLVNSIAQGELFIAEFYLEQEAYSAVIYRANKVLEDFPNSVATERALELLIMSYDLLNSVKNSKEIREIMALNFPDNPLLHP